jgi:type II secretory pathway pseudopilin PulG
MTKLSFSLAIKCDSAVTAARLVLLKLDLRRPVPPGKLGGYALIMLLILMAIVGLTLGAVSTIWTTSSTRDKEQQLLWTGVQFRDAIGSYVKSSPGGAQYPRRLSDLLEDPRFPNVRRHLRQIYRDPFTSKANWGLVKNGDFIVGVYSLAPGAPIKQAGFAAGLESFAEASSYGEWKFVYSGESVAATQGGTPASAQPPTSSLPPLGAVSPGQLADPVGGVGQPKPQRSPQ